MVGFGFFFARSPKYGRMFLGVRMLGEEDVLYPVWNRPRGVRGKDSRW